MNDRFELIRGTAAYPERLEELEIAPERVYGRGDPASLEGPHISVIGARRATPYGIAASMMVGRIAAECDITIVSGGAVGCDAAAARAALASGGKTIVVSGAGADLVYPTISNDVFQGAIDQGGAIISLEPWGQKPRKWTFPKRNQIIAALGDALFVCEAGIRSGTSSTASTAVALGRHVYAVPGSIFSPQSAGTNRLIADGAAIVCSEEDLEAMISLDFDRLRIVHEGCTRAQGRVLSALVASPSRPDDLAVALGEDPITMLCTLSDYESQGIVQRMRDGRYAPSADYLSSRYVSRAVSQEDTGALQ